MQETVTGEQARRRTDLRETPGGSLDDRGGPQALTGKRFLLVLGSLEMGGAERQGLHLARYLKNLGCEVRVLATRAKPGLVVDHCKDAGIPLSVQRFPWPWRKISLLYDSWRMVRALRREYPDVIIAYTTSANVACGLTWRWSPATICIWGQRGLALRGDVMERFAYRRVSAVICNAEHEVGFLRRVLGETPAPVRVVHNGIQLAPCEKTRAEWRTELRIGADATAAIMVANFGPCKDHQTLLLAWRKALESLPAGQTRPRLLLAGQTNSKASLEAAQRLIIALELEDSVNILGQVRDVSGLLAASDMGILTSMSEGLSNSVLEYMAGGLPVVVTDLPANREALGEDPQQPFCKLRDADSLAAHLNVLLHDPDRRRALGARNQRRVAEAFSLSSMCENTVGVVADLLAGRPNPHAATRGTVRDN